MRTIAIQLIQGAEEGAPDVLIRVGEESLTLTRYEAATLGGKLLAEESWLDAEDQANAEVPTKEQSGFIDPDGTKHEPSG